MADSDRTQIKARSKRSPGSGSLLVAWELSGEPVQRRRFTEGFLIGRQSDCGLQLSLDIVSRRHARIVREGDNWTIQDLDSANGTFLDGTRIRAARLSEQASVQLGVDGPILDMTYEKRGVVERAPGSSRRPRRPVGPVSADVGSPVRANARTRLEHPARAPASSGPEARPPSVHADPGSSCGGAPADAPGAVPVAGVSANYPPQQGVAGNREPVVGTESATARKKTDRKTADYYIRDHDDDAGEHTRMLRRAFRQEKEKQERSQRKRSVGFLSLAAVLILLLAAAVGTILWQHEKVARARELAIDLFYDIKTLEIHLAQVVERVRRTRESSLMAEMQSNRAKLKEMSQRYQQYVDELETMGPLVSEEDLLILRIARLFGECDLNMPEAFKEEVKSYIVKWQSSGRLARAIRTLEANGFADLIGDAMSEQDLPPQFLYLGLQESNFNARAIGPETRYGIAKGAWQFIPPTATRFGLKVGPLKDAREHDIQDQRFDFEAATYAAARYLRYIYNTDAQASGLLVMASYNWGEGNIIKRIRKLPENPRERNFWQLVNNYKIPDETYNYVLYIFSAAVIGENPALFGFDFENPLRGWESRATGDGTTSDSVSSTR